MLQALIYNPNIRMVGKRFVIHAVALSVVLGCSVLIVTSRARSFITPWTSAPHRSALVPV
jgi:cell division protein FtsX